MVTRTITSKYQINGVDGQDILLFICYLFLMKPYYIDSLPIISQVWDYLILATVLVSAFIYIINKSMAFRMGSIDNLILLIMLYSVLNSLSKGIVYNSSVRAFLIQLGCMMLTSVSLNKRPVKTIRIIRDVFLVLFSVNLVSILLFPKGMIIMRNYYGFDNRYWFLGNRNPTCRFILSMVCIECFYSQMKNHKLKLKSILLIILSSASIVYLNSVTVIIGLLVVLGLCFMPKSFTLKLRINLHVVFIICAIVSYLIIIIQTQVPTVIKYFIEFFGRNLTFSGRSRIWARAVQMLANHFIFGYGLIGSVECYSLFGASHCHNYFLQILLNNGVVGLVLIFLLYFRVSVDIKKSLQKRHFILMGYALLSSLCILGIAEALTQMPMYYAYFVIIDYFATK